MITSYCRLCLQSENELISLTQYLSAVSDAQLCAGRRAESAAASSGARGVDECALLRQSSLHALSHLMNARRRYCNWLYWVRRSARSSVQCT